MDPGSFDLLQKVFDCFKGLLRLIHWGRLIMLSHEPDELKSGFAPTSFSGAAEKTLKNLCPPGDTSNMLAWFPHLPLQTSDPHGTCDIPVAVIWRAPNSAQLVVVQDRVAFHAELVGAEDV